MTSLVHADTGENLQDVLSRKLSASLLPKAEVTSHADETSSACSGPTSVASAPQTRAAFGSSKVPPKPAMGWLSKQHKMRSTPALGVKADEHANGRLPGQSAGALAFNAAQPHSDSNLSSQRANFVVAGSGKEILMPPSAKVASFVAKPVTPQQSSDARHSPEADVDVVEKDVVLQLSRRLGATLGELSRESRRNKCASNLLQVVDQVNNFHNTCVRYVDALPPHGKFHFREQLTSLQRICDVFKSTSAASNVAEYEKMMTKLQKSVADIETALKNVNIQKVRDKV